MAFLTEQDRQKIANAIIAAERTTSGELVAVVNTPVNGYNRALLGRYPPGSTFKVVTAGALLAGGLRPGDPVDCPKEAKVGGRTFGNFEDEVLGPLRVDLHHRHLSNPVPSLEPVEGDRLDLDLAVPHRADE